MFPNLTNILVCDDSKISRSIVKNYLNQEGFVCVDEVDRADKVLDILLKSNTCNYELLLLDISMPGMSGTDLVAEIRGSTSSYNNLPIIMISAETDKATILSALKNGANDFVLKPVDKDILMQKMDSVWSKLPYELSFSIIQNASNR